MRVGVTGSRGFVGKALLGSLRSSSMDAVPILLPRSSDVFDQKILEDLLENLSVDAIVHMAAVRNPTNEYEIAVNSKLPALLAAVLAQRSPSARFVHISSFNTLLSGRNEPYTISKRRAEDRLKDSAAIIVRPGLLWSWQADAGGDASRIRNYLNRSLPVHPIPYPGQLYRPVILEKFADRLVKLLTENDAPSIIDVLGDKSVTVWDLAKLMSDGRNVRLLPVPTAFMETLLPPAILRLIPVALRSTNSSVPDYSIGLPAEITWEMPFTLPFNNNIDG